MLPTPDELRDAYWKPRKAAAQVRLFDRAAQIGVENFLRVMEASVNGWKDLLGMTEPKRAPVREYGDLEWNPRGGWGGREGWPKYQPDVPESIRKTGRHAWMGEQVDV
jgi:hypothetical protein